MTKFKVGDKLRSTYSPSFPTATVIEITALGFKYDLERPHLLSARLGSITGGESYTDDGWEFKDWEPTEDTLKRLFRSLWKHDLGSIGYKEEDWRTLRKLLRIRGVIV